MSEDRQVHIVGGGIAGLSAAVFAIRDAGVPGPDVHVYETLDVLGGAMDGSGSPEEFYVTRGDRKVNREVFNCLWDVLSAIPSLTAPGKTVKQEIFEYNQAHKKDVQGRLVDKDRNVDKVTTMGFNWPQRIRLVQLIFTPERFIENRRIDSWFTPSFFETNFWKVYSSMFAIEQWNDLAEMRRYVRRFMHDLDKMVKGTGEMVTPYHNNDSIIKPMIAWLNEQGVDFQTGCKVTDLDFAPSPDRLTVERIYLTRDGKEEELAIGEGEYVFVTNGSMTADSTRGSMTAPAELRHREAGRLLDAVGEHREEAAGPGQPLHLLRTRRPVDVADLRGHHAGRDLLLALREVLRQRARGRRTWSPSATPPGTCPSWCRTTRTSSASRTTCTCGAAAG